MSVCSLPDNGPTIVDYTGLTVLVLMVFSFVWALVPDVIGTLFMLWPNTF